MAKVRAAILAAGRGVRMGGAEPKTLTPIGQYESLLNYSLKGLRQAGIDDVLVVTGHRAPDVEAAATEIWGADDLTFIFNARYASWGNFHSVRLAVDQSPGLDLMVVNSDIVVHPEVFSRVLSTSGDLILAVEERHGLDEEDMRVELFGIIVKAIGKDLPLRLSHGEYCGVSLLRHEAARAYSEISTRLEWDARTSIYYEDVYGMMLVRVKARAAPVKSQEYAEVDHPADLERAHSVIRSLGDAWGRPEAKTP